MSYIHFPALCWTLVYLANRPDVQEKLHTELTTHTPPNQPVRLTSRDSLPYLQAVMHEVHRHATVTNLVLHQSRDSTVKLRGFDIPPNTMLFVNVHGPAKDSNAFGGDAFGENTFGKTIMGQPSIQITLL